MIKPVAEAGGYGIVIGPAATDAELEACRRQVEADPRGYIAQEVVALSRHPSLVEDHLEGRHVDLRPFVLSGERIEVIPGGLTRVAMRRGSLVVNSSQGGGSKDTWVLSAEPADARPQERRRRRHRPRAALMLARDAESLFWAGRYLERAESTARLLDVTYHSLLETAPAEEAAAWQGVLSAVRLDQGFAKTGRPLTAAAVSEFLVHDADNPGSILAAVEQARENARTVREQLSTELWESLNSFGLQLRGRNLQADLEFQPHELYGLVRRQCQTVAGVATETMARDEGWRFFVLGWNLERAEMACRLLSVRYRQLSPTAFHEWMATLRSASALEAYRRQYRASMDPVDVVEFLLLSRTFPRSVLFSLRTAQQRARPPGRRR